MSGKKIPVRDSRLIPQERQLEKNLDAGSVLLISGIDGDSNEYSVPEISKYPFGEMYFEGSYGSGIRIGVDRMNEERHSSGAQLKYGGGFGGKGATGCSAVDIYAGLASHATADGKVPDVPVNPNAAKDASRLYLSQLCNVDDRNYSVW